VQTRCARQHCYQSWKGVFQLILESSLLSPKCYAQAVDHLPSTDRWPDGMAKPVHGTVLTGLLQLQAELLCRTVTFGRLCLQQFSPSLNADDTILGQLPLPPDNEVQATKRPIKSEVGNTGGRNGIRNGMDSPTSPGEIVENAGTVITIRLWKGCDLRSREQSVTLDLSLPNN
jgi:hypothetical protein